MTNKEAINLLDNLIGMVEDNQNSDYDKALEMAIDALQQPEIIRCKDCKYQKIHFHEDRRRKGGGYYIYGCELAEGYSHVCRDDDFCSRAERKNNDE